MGTLRDRIIALITKAGPPVKQEMVYTGTKGGDDYQELGLFSFRRLTFPQLDAMRMHSLDENGKFDPNRYAGNNARIVAATLVDDDSADAIPTITVDEINEWPGYMVDAFAAASNRANSNTVTAAKDIEKDSGATDGGAP